MTNDAGTIASTYFSSWKDRDFETLRGLFADDATFRGPLGTADSGDECVQGMQGLRQIITDIEIEKMFVDGPDVLTWFVLHTKVAPPCPTANWTHTEDGKITAIKVTFDARDLAAAS